MAYELFLDSFDHYSSVGELTKKWFSHGGSILSFGNGRYGSNTIAIDDLGGGYFSSFNMTPSSHVTIGFAFYVPNIPSMSPFYVSFASNSGAQFSLTFNVGTNTISAGRSGTTDKTSLIQVPFETWNYLECGLYCADSGSYEIRLNGNPTPIIANTNYDTCVYSNEKIKRFTIGRYQYNNFNRYITFDDLYYAYGDEIKFFGDSRVDVVRLSSDTLVNDWIGDDGNSSNNYVLINQAANNIMSNTLNAVSLFEANNITNSLTTTINGIQIVAEANKNAVGTRAISLLANTNSNIYSSNSNYLTTSKYFYTYALPKNPATSASWTVNDINNLQVGVKVVE